MVDAMRQALSTNEPDEQPDSSREPESASALDLPGLLTTLEEQTARVAELQSTLTINEIEEFASQMRDLGDQHRCQPLSDWSGELADAASMFDAQQMALLLSMFGDLHRRLANG
ncbi:MAG: hypothetical protein HOM68_18905 [Gemmatimonadetes bacterium]|jgi:hypothetical protein|nr:hypothetical protein [Gemmatimonadota bacterium]MBT5058618.1 hypothetical protein [Gemmatimonadota bacterium]MBT5141180.1 hypothetical protein [Gemmatimonadota bacterium]MBT5591999.1 hypothetical protein [Gemmatimonadota bacterium]MBT5964749.1 hypothetical protein [Gemmatimonadota bacterium]